MIGVAPRSLMLGCALTLIATAAGAVEVAPRIGDREVVERLTRLEAGLESLEDRVERLRAEFDARFEQIDSHFVQIDGRFAQIEVRLDQLETRMDRQFDRLHDLMLGLLGAFTAMTASTIGFALWDRRSMLRPLEAAVVDLRATVANDRSRVDALHDALRAFGRSDHRLAEILRRLRLL